MLTAAQLERIRQGLRTALLDRPGDRLLLDMQALLHEVDHLRAEVERLTLVPPRGQP